MGKQTRKWLVKCLVQRRRVTVSFAKQSKTLWFLNTFLLGLRYDLLVVHIPVHQIPANEESQLMATKVTEGPCTSESKVQGKRSPTLRKQNHLKRNYFVISKAWEAGRCKASISEY